MEITYNCLCCRVLHHERLEVEPNMSSNMDFSKIVNDNNTASKQGTMQKETIIQSDNSVFVDDPDVPPLI